MGGNPAWLAIVLDKWKSPLELVADVRVPSNKRGPRSRELVVIFSLLLLTFGVGFAQLTASTNADPDPELPLLTRHPGLHAGIAACCLLLGWSARSLGR